MTVAHALMQLKPGARQVHEASFITSGSSPLTAGFQRLYRAAVLCTRTSYETSPTNLSKPPAARELLGDATEKAIFRFCDQVANAHFNPGDVTDDMRKANPKTGEIPFSSRNKWQASVHTSLTAPGAPRYFLLVKGAPERVMDLCAHVSLVPGSHSAAAGWQKSIQEGCEELGSLGERVLGFAEREIPDVAPGYVFTEDKIMQYMSGMTFLGLLALNDPPRESVPPAIKECKAAGINVVMVTGDFAPTASAIASKIGIFPKDFKASLRKGGDLLRMTSVELQDVLNQETVKLPPLLITGDEINSFEEVSGLVPKPECSKWTLIMFYIVCLVFHSGALEGRSQAC